jgi:hypothetical protein
MSQIEKRKEEETEEFTNLYNLLNKLAANNKDPNKVISIDTDELLRSNKPLEKITKEDTVPTRVLTIDDFLPTPTITPSIATVSTVPISSVPVKPTSPPIPEVSSSNTSTAPPLSNSKSNHAFTVTIGVDVAQQSNAFLSSSQGNKESNMTITIGVDVNSNSSIHVHHPGNNHVPTWDKTIKNFRAEVPSSSGQTEDEEEEQEQEQEQDVQEGEVQKQTQVEEEESSGRREFQIGEGNPLIFNYPSCKACKKSFTHFKFLKSHLKKYPVCNEWIQTMEKDHKAIPKKGVHMLVEDYLHKIITGDKPFQCKYCKNVFTNTSNHHKHYHTFMACNRMAIADFIKHVNEMVT